MGSLRLRRPVTPPFPKGLCSDPMRQTLVAVASPPMNPLAHHMSAPDHTVRQAIDAGGSGSGTGGGAGGRDGESGSPSGRPTPDSGDAFPRGDGERILLVEDEETVRSVTRRLLEKLGYEVETASQAEEALERFEEGADDVDLVLTDIVMPGLTGVEMAEILSRDHPDLKFLFTSGYTSKELGRDPERPPEPFLPKPFSIEELARRVRDALTDPPRS